MKSNFTKIKTYSSNLLFLSIIIGVPFFALTLFFLRDIFALLWQMLGYSSSLENQIIFQEVQSIFFYIRLLLGLATCWFVMAVLGILYAFQMSKKQNQFSKTNIKSPNDLAVHTKQDEVLLSTLDDGVCILDNELRILSVNNAGKTIINKNHNEIIGQNFLDLTKARFSSEADHNCPPVSFDDVIKEKATLKFEEGIIFEKNGSGVVEVKLVVAPLVVGGFVNGVVVVFVDVTQVKATDRMKSEFISVVSHQLRTPLTAIRWFNEMLTNGESGKVTKDQMETLLQMHDSVLRMINLINALLNVSRIESGGISIDPEPTNLRTLIRNLVTEYHEEITLKSQSLNVSVSPEIGLVNLDPILITEVYANLIANALKFTPQNGTIKITLCLEGDSILSEIEDSGCGIPTQNQEDVFSKFFGAEKLFLSDTDGTGLGLYITKTIIEASGGKIWLKSEEGKGTTFSFTIPKTGMMKKQGDKEFIKNTMR